MLTSTLLSGHQNLVIIPGVQRCKVSILFTAELRQQRDCIMTCGSVHLTPKSSGEHGFQRASWGSLGAFGMGVRNKVLEVSQQQAVYHMGNGIGGVAGSSR